MSVYLTQRITTTSRAPSAATLAVLETALSSFRISSPSTATIEGRRHASHAQQGRANGAKDGPGKRLGAKKTGGQYVVPGNILFRQRGTHWFPGDGCFMGRDHTIHAKVPGYVKYYLDPARHRDRKYIGIVFEKHQTLPQPPNAARRRKLGMLAYQMSSPINEVQDGEAVADGLIFSPTPSGADFTNTTPPSIPQPRGTLPHSGPRKITVQRFVAGREGDAESKEATLTLRPGYQWRQANWEIGRAAERCKAALAVKPFRPGDRFLAWRKRTARMARNAERRSLGRGGKGGKKRR